MKKYDDCLFKIGEVCKLLGVSRKAILNYEDHGLLTPAVKDANSSYRYYTADNITHIRFIRSMQELGMSLKEISEYYQDTKNITNHLQRLMELRANLDHNIQVLQMRTAKPGNLSVHRVTLPQQICFCRRHKCADVAEAIIALRNTFNAAAITCKMSLLNRMFTIRLDADASALDLLCCIPVSEEFEGSECMIFRETPALCIFFRGPYEETFLAIRELSRYVKENRIETAGGFRSVYLEGPPNRGEDSANYITQVAIPIAEPDNI